MRYIHVHSEFLNQLGMVLIINAIAWKWLLVVYPHFAPQAPTIQWGTGFCIPVVFVIFSWF